MPSNRCSTRRAARRQGRGRLARERAAGRRLDDGPGGAGARPGRTGKAPGPAPQGSVRCPAADRGRGASSSPRAPISRSPASALEKLTVRAPIDGTVLQINIKAGELAAPSALQPLLLLANLSSAARARRAGRARYLGDQGRPGRLGPRRRVSRARICRHGRCPSRRWSSRRGIGSRGPDSRSDVDAVEVLVDLAQPGPLAVGMRVDVYFARESTAAK